MARRIWIIHKNDKITQQIRDDAIANNCPEIAQGIPPILKRELWGQKLPSVYEEPDPPESEPLRDLASEIDVHLARIIELEKAAGIYEEPVEPYLEKNEPERMA